MSTHRPDLLELTASVEANVSRRFRLWDLADSESCSRDTVQRVFRSNGTTFTTVQRQVRARTAVEEMQRGRFRTAAGAATFVALSTSGLYRILCREYGLTTKDVLRACRLHRRVLRLRALPEPPSGTKQYRRRRERWHKIDSELLTIFATLGAGHPLAPWAHEVLQDAHRPDFRSPENRTRQAIRRAELQAEIERRIAELTPTEKAA